MSDPIVTLATSKDLPNLDVDEAGLPDALRERHIEPRVVAWNDPDYDWNNAGVVVVRSVRDIMAWNSDKHYLRELEAAGLPTIPTTWLEPEENLTKHQVHTRFPAHGDFVVKPAVSSGGRGTGRYTATDPSSRSQAILHAQHELAKGRSVMVQRYLENIDRTGEVSLIFLNGLASYRVEKAPLLHPRFRSADQIQEEVVSVSEARESEWRWGERVRNVLHGLIREHTGRDHLLLFNRVDIVPAAPGDPNEFYVMEISLIDGSLYLSLDESHLNRFADAIAVRTAW